MTNTRKMPIDGKNLDRQWGGNKHKNLFFTITERLNCNYFTFLGLALFKTKSFFPMKEVGSGVCTRETDVIYTVLILFFIIL